MNENVVSALCLACLGDRPTSVQRCAIGQGSYVYAVECATERYIVRCSTTDDYSDTVFWLEQLGAAGIPVPRVIAKGSREEYHYLILNYLEGRDIGEVYHLLTAEEKRTIAVEVAAIQNKTAAVSIPDIAPDWTWAGTVTEMLDRAAQRILLNGYFDVERVERLRGEAEKLAGYFASVQPTSYLDDISTKNLLISGGRVSGVIDVDWIGVGDRMTFVALTNMALLNMEYDTDYVDFLLEEMQVTDAERRAFLFYTLMYCVDFMGERGMVFLDKRIEVSEAIVDRLNAIYDRLWAQWTDCC
ncbi:MAG: aminoglycoside phosphotransferase family protein [Ruminococcaceae bacterium]|nr:aminoglycoside phosphotransferase family protein [Oscillospiraceae bacterium]